MYAQGGERHADQACMLTELRQAVCGACRCPSAASPARRPHSIPRAHVPRCSGATKGRWGRSARAHVEKALGHDVAGQHGQDDRQVRAAQDRVRVARRVRVERQPAHEEGHHAAQRHHHHLRPAAGGSGGRRAGPARLGWHARPSPCRRSAHTDGVGQDVSRLRGQGRRSADQLPKVLCRQFHELLSPEGQFPSALRGERVGGAPCRARSGSPRMCPRRPRAARWSPPSWPPARPTRSTRRRARRP
jgi:hypothetical protein